MNSQGSYKPGPSKKRTNFYFRYFKAIANASFVLGICSLLVGLLASTVVQPANANPGLELGFVDAVTGGVCEKGYVLRDKDEPYEYDKNKKIGYVYIQTRDDDHTCYLYTEDTVDNCFSVEGIGTKDVDVEEIGSGGECERIRAVEFFKMPDSPPETDIPPPTSTGEATAPPTQEDTTTPAPSETPGEQPPVDTPTATATEIVEDTPTSTATEQPAPQPPQDTPTPTNTQPPPAPTSTNTSPPPAPTETNTSQPPAPTSTNTSPPAPTPTNTSAPPSPTLTNTSPPPTATNTSPPAPTSTNTSPPPAPEITNTSPPPTSTNTSQPPAPTSTNTATSLPTSTNTSAPPTATPTNTTPPELAEGPYPGPESGTSTPTISPEELATLIALGTRNAPGTVSPPGVTETPALIPQTGVDFSGQGAQLLYYQKIFYGLGVGLLGLALVFRSIASKLNDDEEQDR